MKKRVKIISVFLLSIIIGLILFSLYLTNIKTPEKQEKEKGVLYNIREFLSFAWLIKLFKVEQPVVQAPATALEDCDVLVAAGTITSYGCDYDTCCGPKTGPFLNADGSVYYTCSSSPGGVGPYFEANDIYSEQCWGFNPETGLSDISCYKRTKTCNNWCHQMGFPSYYAVCVECGDTITDEPAGEDCDKGKKCSNLISCTTENDCSDGSACIPRNIGKCSSQQLCNELNPCLDGSECKIECYNNCKNKPCISDADCGGDFCDLNNLYKNKCVNPGEPNAYCTIELKQECGVTSWDDVNLNKNPPNPQCYCTRGIGEDPKSNCYYSGMERGCNITTKKCYEGRIQKRTEITCGISNGIDFTTQPITTIGDFIYYPLVTPKYNRCYCNCIPCKDCEKCNAGPESSSCEADSKKLGKKCHIEGDYKDEKNGICNDKGDCISSECNPAPDECQKCDTTVVPPKAVADSSKNGNDCTTSENNDGYCDNGKCIEKTCEKIGFTTVCGGADSIGLNCCKPTETCCFSERCCASSEACKKFDFTDPAFGTVIKTISYCDPNQCTIPELPVLCPGTTGSFCCPAGTTCLSLTKSKGGSQNNVNVAYCGQNQCDASKGETPCGQNENFQGNGVYCCKQGYTCKKISELEFPRCIINTGCTGKAPEYDDITIKCKPKIEICGWHPNGFPRCINNPSNTGNPVSSTSTSIYMVRNKEGFSLNGIAYLIKPKINFSFNVYVAFNYTDYAYQGYNLSEIETYKYEDDDIVLESCNSVLLDYVYQNVTKNGATINFNGKIAMFIFNDALTDETEITIEKYNLTECENIEERDSLLEFLDSIKDLPAMSEIRDGSFSGAGDSGGIITRALPVSSEQLKNGYSSFLVEKDSFQIQAGSLKKEKHSVKINELDFKNKKINLIIQSSPISINLNLGEKTKVDLDDDKVYDIFIEFRSIKNSKAEIYVKEISEIIKTETQEPSETEEKPYVIEKTNQINNILLIGSIILILIIIISVLFKKRNIKPSRKLMKKR